MRRGRRGAWITTAVVVLLLVGLGALLGWLRATAPAVDTADLAVTRAVVTTEDLPRCDDLEGPDRDVVPDGQRVTSVLALSCPRAFDERTVTYVGEVVGDVLQRTGGSWVLLNDDAYALGLGPLGASGVFEGGNSGLTVWLPDPLDELADEPGRRDTRGDVLLVEGQLLREDPADGGGLTIRASSVELLAQAVTVDVPVHVPQLVVAGVLGLLAVAVGVAEQRRGRR